MTENLPVHSPLGASSAERWMNCPGSNALLKTLALPETDEPDYRANGIAAHEAAAHCLTKGLDAWEIVGEAFHNVAVDTEIADAIQLYLDTVRPIMAAATHTMVEHRISSPAHPLFYGTVDFAAIGEDLLTVADYKHGEGISVDVEQNPQIMYYAYGVLQDHPELRRVRLMIVQPRGFHSDGPVREWTISAEDLAHWGETILIPAMNRAELDSTLDAGPWCRFCPAKLVCPLMTSLFGAACKANPKDLVNYTDASVGRSYQYLQAVKFYIKALEEDVLRRLQNGTDVPGVKLVNKKANRVWKDGSQAIFEARFGKDVFTEPSFKSPAEIDKLGDAAKQLVREWAYTPNTGVTVALADDPRIAVKVEKPSQTFAAAAAKVVEGDQPPPIPDFLRRT